MMVFLLWVRPGPQNIFLRNLKITGVRFFAGQAPFQMPNQQVRPLKANFELKWILDIEL